MQKRAHLYLSFDLYVHFLEVINVVTSLSTADPTRAEHGRASIRIFSLG
jgi:hypothetical protein